MEADAENLPFDDESYDVVMSSIGAMFAPHHQDVADELVRVCRPGGTIALLSWTPEGMIGALFRTMGPFAPPPRPARSRRHCGEARTTSRAVRRPRRVGTLERDDLDITAFEHPRDYGEHFKGLYGPTIVASATRSRTARSEFDEALNNFSDEWIAARRTRALRAGVPGRGRHPDLSPATPLTAAVTRSGFPSSVLSYLPYG